MTAKRILGADLRSKNRLPLQELIPLSTPLALFIDPGNACNIKCSFCPTGDKALLKQFSRKVSVMSFDLFRKIVNDIKQFGDKIKVINLYKDGEPLVNKNFIDMVGLLKSTNVAEKIQTKTNGLLINERNLQSLASCGLDEIGISVIAPDEKGYLRIAGVNIDYNAFLDNVANFYQIRGSCKIYIKMANAGFSQDEIMKFYSDFEDKCDYISVENLHGWSMSEVKDFTLGMEKSSFDGIELTEKISCPWPFYQMGINSNGTVGLCNDDWAHKTIIGDINFESLIDIWNGPRMLSMRKMHLDGRRSENEACASCYYISCAPDNIDPYRKEILKKLNLA